MGRPRFDPSGPQRPTGPRINQRIRVPEIRVIDDAGSMLGIMATNEALRIAKDRELDLVEINPKADPPVCKIMDFGKFKYEEKKQQAAARKRQTTVEVKEVKLRPKTDEHDIDFKSRQIKRFLEEGNKVKLTVRFRGREITHPEQANKQIDRLLERLDGMAIVEMSSRMEGKTMTVLLSPKGGVVPAGPRKPAPAKPEGAPAPEPGSSPAPVTSRMEIPGAAPSEEGTSQ